MTRDEYIAAIKSAAITVIKADIVAWAVSVFPFFGAGPLGLVLKIFSGSIAKFIVENGEAEAFFKYIDFRTTAQGREFEKAALKNIEAQKSGDKDAKQKAETYLIDSLRAVVRIAN